MNTTKKIIFTLAAAVLAAGLSHAGDLDLYEHVSNLCRLARPGDKAAIQELKEISDYQWTVYADQYAATNKTLFQATGKHAYYDNIRLFGVYLNNKLENYSKSTYGDDRLLYEYDAKFADAGIYYNSLYFGDNMPNLLSVYFYYHRMNEVYAETHTNAYARRPALYAVAERIYAAGPNAKGKYRNPTAAEYINMLVEGFATRTVQVNNMKKCILQAAKFAIGDVRHKIRENGGTFVVGPNEENPVQDAIDQLIAALESPNCTGAREWVETWCLEPQWVDVSGLFKSKDFVDKLRYDIYYGHKELTDDNKKILIVGLGLDEYNRFIEEYNGVK